MEMWKSIDENSVYFVSDLGRVKSLISGFERYLKLTPHRVSGYISVKIKRKGKTYTIPVHRLVAEAFIPNPLNLPMVDHLFSIKTDNRSSQLEWVTNQQNIQRSYDRGTHRPSSGNTKIPGGQVDQIIKFYSDGLHTIQEIADKFSVHSATIGKILRRAKIKTWRGSKKKNLSKEDVIEIRRVYLSDKNRKSQAARFNLSLSSLWRVATKRSYSKY